MTPREIDACDLWEFNAMVRGYEIAHGLKRPSGEMSEDRAKELGIVGF